MHATISIAPTALHGLGEPIPGPGSPGSGGPASAGPPEPARLVLQLPRSEIASRLRNPQSGFRISLLPYRRHFQFYSESLLELFRIGE